MNSKMILLFWYSCFERLETSVHNYVIRQLTDSHSSDFRQYCILHFNVQILTLHCYYSTMCLVFHCVCCCVLSFVFFALYKIFLLYYFMGHLWSLNCCYTRVFVSYDITDGTVLSIMVPSRLDYSNSLLFRCSFSGIAELCCPDCFQHTTVYFPAVAPALALATCLFPYHV